MNVRLFLNELSLEPMAPDIPSGHQRMKVFLQTVGRVRQIVRSARVVLHTLDAPDAILLAPNYPIAFWRRDAEQAERLKFLQLAIQVPLIERSRDAEDLVEGHLRMECRHDGRVAKGVGAAIVTEGLAVSFPSAQCWETPILRVEVDEIDEYANVHFRQLEAKHASAPSHVEAHEGWLRELERLTIKDGQDLWDRREELFPDLEFCKEVRTQLWEFLGGDVALGQVVRRLVQLQKFFVQWDGSPISPDSLPSKCTPESQATLKKFPQEHTFTPPDGTAQIFSWHVRFTPGAGRIFFDGDPVRKKGLVAYVGKGKLPTVSG